MNKIGVFFLASLVSTSAFAANFTLRLSSMNNLGYRDSREFSVKSSKTNPRFFWEGKELTPADLVLAHSAIATLLAIPAFKPLSCAAGTYTQERIKTWNAKTSKKTYRGCLEDDHYDRLVQAATLLDQVQAKAN